MAPAVKPVPTTTIAATRTRGGEYSPTSAIAFGMILPSPTPATKRITSNCSTEVTRAVNRVTTEKNRHAPINTGLRPIRSASILSRIEPNNTPTSAALSTDPSTAPVIFHSSISRGATKPIACTSKPSIIRQSAHRTNSPNWKGPILLCAITSETLILAGPCIGRSISTWVEGITFRLSLTPYVGVENMELAKHALMAAAAVVGSALVAAAQPGAVPAGAGNPYQRARLLPARIREFKV